MAKFCKFCGKALAEGEICNCKGQQNQNQMSQKPQKQQQAKWQREQQLQQQQITQEQQSQWQQQNVHQQSGQSQWQQGVQQQWQRSGQQQQGQSQNQWGEWAKNAASSFPQGDTGSMWSSLRERMGIGEPEYYDSSPYEEGKKIIPDIVKANEGEAPIRQYDIATLKNKTFGITYAKASGRIQITNKRIIFRAPGKSIIGTRTSLQHEFLIDEVGGIEARREHIFNKGDLFLGFLLAWIGYLIMSAVVIAAIARSGDGAGFAFYFLSVFFGVAGAVPFFVMKKKWLLKMFFAGGSLGALLTPFLLAGNWFFAFLSLAAFAILLASGFFHSIRPNLVLSIKPKGAVNAVVDIRRTSTGIGGILQRSGGSDSDDHTGFREIFPEKDAEKAIREIGAIINDIQKLGDYAISKWQQ